MKVSIDPALCQGHGLCYMNASELFDDDDEGYGVAPVGDIDEADTDLAEQAVTMCPEQAISIVER